jgi:DnaJ family protein C protein 25
LRDDESRKNYDYLLDNPDEFYRHWWYYHRPRVSTQIDAGLVIIVLLTLISGLQYYFINDSYRRQIKTILEYDDKLLTKVWLMHR